MNTSIKEIEKDNRLPWKMLAWLVVLQILVAFVGRSLAPLGPLIGEDLSLTKTQIGLLPTALFIGQSFIALPSGFLTDKIGTRKMLFLIAISLGGSFIIMTFISFFAGILLMIVIGGLGYGASHPASNRGIIDWFQVEKRGLTMGIKQMGITVGSALSVIILLPIADEWGWRTANIIASLLVIVVGCLAYINYRAPQNESVSTVPKQELKKLLKELIQLAKNRALLLISLAAMILNSSQVIFNTFIILFAYEFLGISLILAGFLLITAEVGGSVGRIAWGIISDKLFKSRRVIIILIISIINAGMAIIFTTLPPGVSIWTMIPLTFIFGFCVSGFNGIWMNATTEIVSVKKSGIATGFSITIGSWGVLIGPPVFGFIVDHTGAYMLGWMFVFLLMVIVIILLLAAMTNIKREGYNI